jgi:hypothetical protein
MRQDKILKLVRSNLNEVFFDPKERFFVEKMLENRLA